MLGGYGDHSMSAVTKTYDELPTHGMIHLEIRVAQIDNWPEDWNVRASVYVDDVRVFVIDVLTNVGLTTSVCGSDSGDTVRTFRVSSVHVASKAKVRVSLSRKGYWDDQYWGLSYASLATGLAPPPPPAPPPAPPGYFFDDFSGAGDCEDVHEWTGATSCATCGNLGRML